MKATPLISLLTVLILSCVIANAESSNPRLLDGKMPSYTESARASGIEGVVIVEALVDENGRVFAADVVQSLSPELDALTLKAVQGWKFQPATEDGKAILKVVQIPVNFNLVDPMDETVNKAREGAVAAR